MKLIRFVLFALIGSLYIASFAAAQTPDVVYNLPLWGRSVLTFALVLTLFTQAVKVRLQKALPALPAFVIQLGTLALGVIGAFVIDGQGLLVDPLFASLSAPLNWLAFGGIAGVLAIGGYDLLLAIIGFAKDKRIGGAVVTVPWVRNERAATAGLKTTSYVDYVIALARAKEQGALEAIFGNTRGELCEATGSNVFVVLDSVVHTPPLDSGCLAGITRELVLEWCAADGVEVVGEAAG